MSDFDDALGRANRRAAQEENERRRFVEVSKAYVNELRKIERPSERDSTVTGWLVSLDAGHGVYFVTTEGEWFELYHLPAGWKMGAPAESSWSPLEPEKVVFGATADQLMEILADDIVARRKAAEGEET